LVPPSPQLSSGDVDDCTARGRRETHIAAPPATVFAFLTNPDKILSWMGAEATTEAHPDGLDLVKGIGDRAWSRLILSTGMAAPYCA